MGQHFAHLVEESRREGILSHYYSSGPKPGDPRGRHVETRTYGLCRYTPLRFFPSWETHVRNEFYDRSIASRLEGGANRFMGFAGKSLHSFRRARELGYDVLELVAPNSHVENVYRLHEKARRQTGISDSWLNRTHLRKTVREYRLADVIYTHSDYTAESLREKGIPSDKLERTHLSVDTRFEPPDRRPEDGIFRVVYVGRVDATKGIPLLVEAFSELPVDRAELRLVGGWTNRPMRRYMEKKMAEDERITVEPGDPLPVLHRADVFVHPTYEDGFGYAPMEALACGVPVIVTEDTGMKEYVREEQNGFIVPTGDTEALLRRLRQVHRHPLARTSSLLPSSAPEPTTVRAS